MSLAEALKRTKEGSEGEGGRKEPTSTSLACEGGGSLITTSGRGIKATPFKNSLLRVCREALIACKDEDEDETVIWNKEVNAKVDISDWGN